MLMTRCWIALAILGAVVTGTAAAQERPEAFPSRSIKIVVPFPAGGPSDVLARMIGQKMSEDWGRSEERRVGKECRCRGSPDHLKKKTKKKSISRIKRLISTLDVRNERGCTVS